VIQQPVSVPTPEVLSKDWRDELSAARRKLETAPVNTLIDKLHAGTEKWFDYLIGEGVSADGWKPIKAGNLVFGNNPAYGNLTQCLWENGNRTADQGVAFFAGKGSAMPRDLEAKLSMMASSKRVVKTLLILWPKELNSNGPVHEQLPAGTRKIWDDYMQGDLSSRVRMIAVEPGELAQWLALESWETVVRDHLADVPASAVNNFVSRQTQGL